MKPLHVATQGAGDQGVGLGLRHRPEDHAIDAAAPRVRRRVAREQDAQALARLRHALE